MNMNSTNRHLEKKKGEKLKEKRDLYKARFKTVKRWRAGVVSDTSGSAKTEMKHLNYLIKFCEHIGMNPDEIIEARIQDLTSADPTARYRFEDEVKGCSAKLKTENGYYVAREVTTSMKSFFQHNHVPLAMKSPKMKDPETYTPTKEAIEKLYRAATPGWERSRISFTFQSGARRGSLRFMKYKHIKRDFEAGVIPVHIHLNKEEVKAQYFGYDTFIGKQAVEDLRLALELRKRGTRKMPKEKISDESPLFPKENTHVIEPCDETAFTTFFVSLSRRACLSEEETITPHAIRRATETSLEASNMIPQNWIDHIMGHRPSGAQGKHYSRPTVEQLRAAYAKAESYLTLNSESPVDVAAALKTANETVNTTPTKNERLETKPLDRLTEEDIRGLLEKRQQVQQSLDPYLNPLSIQTQSLDIGNNFLDDDKRDKTLATEKIRKDPSLLSYLKAETRLPENKRLESMPRQVGTAAAKDELIRILEDFWQKLSNGEYVMRKDAHLHTS